MLKLLAATSLLLAGLWRVEGYAAEKSAGAKRQVQYAEQVPRAQPQYVPQPAALQISPEYYAYLQQVQAQQYQAQQPSADLSQALSARGPQRFQQPMIPRRQPVPEETRRLQESFAQRPIQDQEREDLTNQQLIASGLNPTQVRRERLRQSAQRLAAQQAEENAARQALQAQEQQYQQLYGQPQPTNLVQLVPVPQEIPVQQPSESTPAPDRVSYSQVAFGSTKLPQQRLTPGRTQLIYNRPQTQQPVAYRQPQPQQQPQQQVVYQPQYVYTTIPQRVKSAQPQQSSYPQQEAPQSRAGPQLVYTQQAERSQDAYQPQRGEALAYQPQRGEAVAFQPQRPRPVAYQPQRPKVVPYQPQRAQPDSYQPQRAQPESYQPQRAQPESYQPQRAQTNSYQPERTVTFQTQPQPAQYPQAEVTQKQTPDQYLIETTRTQPEPQQQVITIPRRQQFSYRPQSDYQELQAALIARQQQAHLARQQAEASASTTPAPRSSIYVTTARTSVPKAYSLPAEYSSEHQHRPLTESELNALINAGFRVGSDEQEEQYDPRLSKRQNARPRIGKVPLSQEEKEMLAKNGIRSLYRVQTAESQDAPVTYVLAIENQKRETKESTSS